MPAPCWRASTTWPSAPAPPPREAEPLGAEEARALEDANAAQIARADAPTPPDTKVTELKNADCGPDGLSGFNCGYNQGWKDPGTRLIELNGEKRASIITHPANGQMPALTPAAHLTCVAATREEVDAVIGNYVAAGVRHIVALRGDPPGGAPYQVRPDGYAYAADLVAGLRRIAPFDISVAAYPEVHPAAPSADFDLDNLKRKADAGADRALTQFFFDTEAFLRFRDRAAASGIGLPIVPGILPITNFARTKEFATACGAAVPDWLEMLFEGLDETPDTRQLVAASVAVEQCRLLQTHGVEEFHFYTLNRAELTLAICRFLGIRPRRAEACAA